MRIKVILDTDVAAKLKELAQQRRASFTELLNDVLRDGLSSLADTSQLPERYVVIPHAGGFRPGIDPDKLGQLLDDLEVADCVHEARASE